MATIATATASFMVIADCEACSNVYHWNVTIEHTVSSGLIMGRLDDPRLGLAKKLLDKGIPILKPCSQCGYTQSYMRSSWEDSHRHDWLTSVIFVVIGIFVIILGISKGNEDLSDGLIFGIVGGITALCAVPVGRSMARELSAGPNRKWHKKHGDDVPPKKDFRVEPSESGMTVCPACRQQTKGKLNRGRVAIIIFFCLLPIFGMRMGCAMGGTDVGAGLTIPLALLASVGACVALVVSRRIKALWPQIICANCKHTWRDEC